MTACNVIYGTPDIAGNLIWRIDSDGLGFAPAAVWNSSPSETNFIGYYDVPHTVTLGTTFREKESASRFSPPPFAVAVRGAGGERMLLVIAAERGHHNFAAVDFACDSGLVTVTVELEGHSDPEQERNFIRLELTAAKAGETELELLQRGLMKAYPEAAQKRRQYDWWNEPLYCAFGSCMTSAFHAAGKPGAEALHMAYETEAVIQRQLDLLDAADVPWRTLIIDCGWSPGGIWKPYPERWSDLKGFIARQHERGHKVMLWIGLWFTGGLPDKWCIFAEKGSTVNRWDSLTDTAWDTELKSPERFWADAANPEYLAFVAAQVRELISPEGFDADGFKIDMLQQTPCERFAQGREHWDEPLKSLLNPHANTRYGKGKWGVELLYDLQKTIYDAAKSVKSDALVNSSTVHPYFADTFDMMRLHDTCYIEENTDVFKLMAQRAYLAHAALPYHVIDTDNWIHTYLEKWMDYTLNSWKLGTPCIIFTDRFVTSFTEAPGTCPIPFEYLQKLGANWRKVLGLRK